MKVRFIRAWQNYRVGDEIEPGGVFRDELMRRGFIEVVKEQPIETAQKPKAETLPRRRKHQEQA